MQREKLIQQIKGADIFEVDDILEAAMQRKRELYPDWELFYCAAEKGTIHSPEDLIRAAWEFENRIRRNYPK